MGSTAVGPADPMGEPTGGLLRLITCGSVDDGKSTLIGRLLYDTHSILQDQFAALERDTRRGGTTPDAEVDFSLLVDGLEAERQQGITIDVAYRSFTTDKRRFIVADTPGHEQYTRNMATGASTADLAIVLVDARKGVLTQTRRHSLIASLMGIRHVVLAINKIDLIGYDPAQYDDIHALYATAVAGLGFQSLVAIPISARFGDNVATFSPRTPWYAGSTLLGHIETVPLTTGTIGPFRMPVQLVHRPAAGVRRYAGTIASGLVRPGDRVCTPSGRQTCIRLITTAETVCGPAAEAIAGQAVTLELDDEIDLSRGDVLSAANAPVAMAENLQAHMVWLDEAPLRPGRSYLFKIGTCLTPGNVSRVCYRINLSTYGQQSASELRLNEAGVVEITLATAVAFEPYGTCRALGGFIVIDRHSNATAGVGMIDFASRGATNVEGQDLAVDHAARRALMGQSPAVLWLTGLSGSGKSTIATLLERRLHAEGHHTYLLDGDIVRLGLNRDLGFTEADRVENIRRVAEVAALMVDAGLLVIVALISPYRSERDAARAKFAPGKFVEIFIDTAIGECRRRDPKGLYRRADAGLLPNFTGVDAPYEIPPDPDIHVRTEDGTPEQSVARIMSILRRREVLGRPD